MRLQLSLLPHIQSTSSTSHLSISHTYNLNPLPPSLHHRTQTQASSPPHVHPPSITHTSLNPSPRGSPSPVTRPSLVPPYADRSPRSMPKLIFLPRPSLRTLAELTPPREARAKPEREHLSWELAKEKRGSRQGGSPLSTFYRFFHVHVPFWGLIAG